MFKLVDVIHSHEHKTLVCSDVAHNSFAEMPEKRFRVAVISSTVCAETGNLKTLLSFRRNAFVQTGGTKLKFTVMCPVRHCIPIQYKYILCIILLEKFKRIERKKFIFFQILQLYYTYHCINKGTSEFNSSS